MTYNTVALDILHALLLSTLRHCLGVSENRRWLSLQYQNCTFLTEQCVQIVIALTQNEVEQVST